MFNFILFQMTRTNRSSRYVPGTAGWLCALIGSVVFFAGCAVNDYSAHNPVLSGSSLSAHELGVRVLEGLYRKDDNMLSSISITEHEYRQLIWPQLPISRIDQWKNHIDFVWKQHSIKSRACMQTALSRYGGTRYELVDIRYEGDTSIYDTFMVHGDARLIVRDTDDKIRELNVFGSVVEMYGQYKVMSYNIH